MGNETVPDARTIELLQQNYAEAILTKGNLQPNIPAKYARMQKLSAKCARDKKPDPKIIEDLDAIAVELLSYFYFKVDNVNWKEQWNARKRELRHNGIVVRLGPAT